MAFGKWIGAWLGWINSQSVLGGMAGFALGLYSTCLLTERQKKIRNKHTKSKLSTYTSNRKEQGSSTTRK